MFEFSLSAIRPRRCKGEYGIDRTHKDLQLAAGPALSHFSPKAVHFSGHIPTVGRRNPSYHSDLYSGFSLIGHSRSRRVLVSCRSHRHWRRRTYPVADSFCPDIPAQGTSRANARHGVTTTSSIPCPLVDSGGFGSISALWRRGWLAR